MARPVVERTADEWAVVGRFLQAVRDARGWSQEKAAVAAGISRTPLSMLEKGEPQNNRPLRSTLDGIRRAYGLPPEWWDQVIKGSLDESAIQGDIVRTPVGTYPTDYNSRMARMPSEVEQQINDIIDEEERRQGLR